MTGAATSTALAFPDRDRRGEPRASSAPRRVLGQRAVALSIAVHAAAAALLAFVPVGEEREVASVSTPAEVVFELRVRPRTVDSNAVASQRVHLADATPIPRDRLPDPIELDVPPSSTEEELEAIAAREFANEPALEDRDESRFARHEAGELPASLRSAPLDPAALARRLARAEPRGEDAASDESARPTESAAVSPAPSPSSANSRIAARPLSARNAPPTYPPGALQLRIEGRVVLAVDVAADGSVTHVEVRASSRHDDLDAAAVAAVRGWRFEPALESGRPVASRLEVPIVFRLADRR